MLRSLLVCVDLSPSSDRVVARAAALPLGKNAKITLLHVVPKLLPSNARKRAEADARRALELHAKVLARAATGGVVIRQVVKAGSAAGQIATLARSSKAELVVVGRGGGRVRDVFLGSTAERVIRQGQLPVLVVRLAARGAYARPAMALALDEAADEVIETMLKVIEPPRLEVTLIHAYRVPFEATVYPSLSSVDAEEWRTHEQRKARQELAKLLNSTLERSGIAQHDAPIWKLQVRLGSPRTVIPRAVEQARADLLVLGTHGHAGLAHAFLGTVAGDLLREVACDALVVPPRHETSEPS